MGQAFVLAVTVALKPMLVAAQSSRNDVHRRHEPPEQAEGGKPNSDRFDRPRHRVVRGLIDL